MKKIAVIGLGYVGLPMAALSAIKGFNVIGYELNHKVVGSLQQGKSHIKDESTERLLGEALVSGNFHPTTDVSQLDKSQIYLICVPTPIDENHDPDLKPLLAAIETIIPYLKKDDLVIVESTVFPGTCEQIVIPLIEKKSGLKSGIDFNLAHCPERVNPGDLFWTSENIPRVVGATTAVGVDAAAEFYATILGGQIFDVADVKNSLKPKFSVDENKALKIAQIPLASITKMRSIRDAEAVKAMENTVRDVNIAFVNELAKISDVLDLDVVDIIDGMSTKPFGKGPFYPGVGVGGHCIAVDPEWLKSASKSAGYMPKLIDLSRTTNNSMPAYTIALLQDLLNKKKRALNGTKIAVLGVAYKANVDDPRESPFYEIKKILKAKGAELNIFDSWVKTENNVNSLEQALADAKAAIVVTNHNDIIQFFNAYNFSESSLEVFIDGRNCIKEGLFKENNILYHGIGRHL